MKFIFNNNYETKEIIEQGWNGTLYKVLNIYNNKLYSLKYINEKIYNKKIWRKNKYIKTFK